MRSHIIVSFREMEILFHSNAVFVTPAQIPHAHGRHAFHGGLVTCCCFDWVGGWEAVTVEIPVSHFHERVDIGLAGLASPVYQGHVVFFMTSWFIKELQYHLPSFRLR